MTRDLPSKTRQYERLLAEALGSAEVASPTDTPLGDAGVAILEMARSYLDDGRHFVTNDDYATALAAFSYGHGWLDAGARLGVLRVPTDSDLFSI